jgi:hypothetical protein
MAKQLQPTSLLLFAVLIVVVLVKYAYDKGTAPTLGG